MIMNTSVEVCMYKCVKLNVKVCLEIVIIV